MTEYNFFGGFFVTDYSGMCDVLTRELAGRGRFRSLAVAVFASARDQFTKTHLLPHVEYWNCRSKAWVDFFFLGYLGDDTPDDDSVTVNSREDKGFHEETFVEAIERFERSGWRYSGRPSVLIFQSGLKQRVSDGKQRAFPDLTNYIDFAVEEAISDHAIDSVEKFFERIIRFAKTQSEINPQWRLSDVVAGESIVKALGDAVFENLPIKGVKRVLMPLKYFRVKAAG